MQHRCHIAPGAGRRSGVIEAELTLSFSVYPVIDMCKKRSFLLVIYSIVTLLQVVNGLPGRSLVSALPLYVPDALTEYRLKPDQGSIALAIALP